MSNNLDRTLIAEGAANPETAVNDIFALFDAAFTEFDAVDVSAGNQSVTATTLRSNAMLRVTGAAVPRVVTLAAVRRLIVVENTGSAEITLACGTGEVDIPAGEAAMVRLDGTTNGLSSIPLGSSGGGGVSTFVALTDGPGSFSGQGGKLVAVNSGGTALEYVSPGTTGAEEFTDLSDVPSSYSGQAGKMLIVNGGETGLEFDDVPGGGGGGSALAPPVKPPTLSLFSLTRNGTGVTQTQTEGAGCFSVVRTDLGANSAYRYAFKGKAVPAGSSWTAIAGFKYNKFFITNSICIGLGVRLASTDRMLSVQYEDVNGTLRHRAVWHIGDNYQTALAGIQPRRDPEYLWTKITWDGTDYKFYISGNFGNTWLLLDTRAAASYITADQIGILVQTYHDISLPDQIEVNCIYYSDPDFP